MSDSFLEFAFVALIALEAALFTAFGVLFSVYSMHMASLSEEHPYPPLIVEKLVWLSWTLTTGMLIATCLALICLYHIDLNSLVEHIVRLGLILIVIGLTLASLIVNSTMTYPKRALNVKPPKSQR